MTESTNTTNTTKTSTDVHWTKIVRMSPIKLTQKEILDCVKDRGWQQIRVGMKGLSTTGKLYDLDYWLEINRFSRDSKVQVMNYINALKRGGQLDKRGFVVTQNDTK